jgi:hypothetical protein
MLTELCFRTTTDGSILLLLAMHTISIVMAVRISWYVINLPIRTRFSYIGFYRFKISTIGSSIPQQVWTADKAKGNHVSAHCPVANCFLDILLCALILITFMFVTQISLQDPDGSKSQLWKFKLIFKPQ